MVPNQLFILTGAPGSGKSTLLARLHAEGLTVVPEPARQILAEQRAIGGRGIPGIDNRLFVDLLLDRAVQDYHCHQSSTLPVIFDRGIPDVAGYAMHFGSDHLPARKAASEYRYNNRVFFAPSWEAIYTTDHERKMSFEASRAFGQHLRSVYTSSDYEVIDLPVAPLEERLQFVIELISAAEQVGLPASCRDRDGAGEAEV